MTGDIAFKEIDRCAEKLNELSQRIWNHPEVAYHEVKAMRWTAELMREEGFAVEEGAYGVPTALRAVWGSGHPIIGYLGEYDALPNLSQRVCTHKEPIEGQRYGHGCGHNLICVGHAAAAIGMKKELEQRGLSGTVVFYGCPAEESDNGKAIMARGGAFKDLDAAMAFHPSWFTYCFTGGKLGGRQIKFHFTGKTSHAGSSPQNGRSALAAVELLNVGANYLKTYLPPSCRLFYTISDVGGDNPGVIPEHAAALYSYKGGDPASMEECRERLINVAKGAAMMTGTTVEVEMLGGYSALVNNNVLLGVLDEALRSAPQEPFTPEEIAFAKELDEGNEANWRAKIAQLGGEEIHLQYGVLPIRNFDTNGSTDVGDVSQIVPTIFCKVACYNVGTNGHTWQTTVCAGSSFGFKGAMFAGKALAAAGIRLAERPDLVVRAKEEFDRTFAGQSYVCPMPADFRPPNPDEEV